MHRLLAPWADTLYATMRVAVGLSLALHGPVLLLGWWGGVPFVGASAPLLSVTGIGGTISLVGGLLVALGLFSSPSAFISSGMLAVGYVLRHAPHGWLPIANGGENAVLYAFVLLYIAARGSGSLSVDGMLRGTLRAHRANPR